MVGKELYNSYMLFQEKSKRDLFTIDIYLDGYL